jgi:alkanesulfonate monooxygenase SsuD/methylene tetrahydromethanopterin reductase-like flavin-dependent oxidoreductase (luciferase family)
MTGCLVGADEAELHERARRLAAWQGDPDARPDEFLAALPASWLVGTVDQVVEGLRELRAAGVDRVMLQDLLFEDLEMVDLIGSEVIPALV